MIVSSTHDSAPATVRVSRMETKCVIAIPNHSESHDISVLKPTQPTPNTPRSFRRKGWKRYLREESTASRQHHHNYFRDVAPSYRTSLGCNDELYLNLSAIRRRRFYSRKPGISPGSGSKSSQSVAAPARASDTSDGLDYWMFNALQGTSGHSNGKEIHLFEECEELPKPLQERQW